jgi:hypothetical protein
VDRNVRALIIALLCVLAVSLAAATLTNPQQPAGIGDGPAGSGPDASGVAPDEGDGSNSGAGIEEDRNTGESVNVTAGCIPFLLSPTFGGLVVVTYVVLGAIIYRRDGLGPAIAVLFLLTVAAFPLWSFFTDCGVDLSSTQGGGVNPEVNNETQPHEESGGSSGTESVFTPPTVLAALGVVVVLLAVVAFRATGDDEPPETPPIEAVTDDADEEVLGALGDVAGEAADRIDDAVDVDNEVYRAWGEMTTYLDVDNPESSTPAEFAAAAEAVGMDDAHVTELTDLFREVRYGGADATEDREQRAVDALRDIESTYGGGE